MEFIIGEGRTVKLNPDGVIPLFHGTAAANADCLVEFGPKANLAIAAGGTGEFWVAVDFTKAVTYGSVSTQIDIDLAIVSFQLPVSVINYCLTR
jgi:hypothetical protein